MKVRRLLIVAALGIALLAGCATTEQKPMAAQERSLYERRGGKEAITAVVDDFVGHVAADNRINSFFATTDVPRFKLFPHRVLGRIEMATVCSPAIRIIVCDTKGRQ